MVQIVVPDAGAPAWGPDSLEPNSMRICPLTEPKSQAATHAGAAAMRLRGVTIEFALPRGGHYPAVAATDLAVGANEFVAIVGPTGCGKSTLLNVAAGLLAPSSGESRCWARPSPAST